ncbi:cell division cycle 5-like protein [Stylonychia lemnae]|uniref:Cell division cycle 5-like protein n=1 Tax=Stylonychia lemnae TaxID=5949 RepID=A0A077ZMK1_STYLE|nr:cell division cycle 5-like protein [Stylonychia lemnae]|eukprot:CDW71197.1 cell division cycle 5-like protein [Stylonychia lemnae]
MRYMVKGGIWKNTEDEILKAAVMKYGLNQWSRISSLLVRKSAKECKARWYEWLDPAIKKTEWNREEEEKLLYLAKIFPTQWRTIAPIIGRTPAQCIEHYERLLDAAQGKTGDLDENDPRKLRPGEIDPNPETKPCRPDPVDMDEDEKEMLQECRARLANTKGKKAKRKAREKQLEEARRMAQTQKQRELKAAGIDVYKPTKIRGVNYNIEIPFEKKVPVGRFDIEGETIKIDQHKANIALQQIEIKRRDEEEKKRRALDAKKLKKLKQKNLPKALEIINKNSDSLIGIRTKLTLPSPQINDDELEMIKKYADGNHDGMAIAGVDNNAATRALMGNYSQRDMLQTPMIGKTPLMSQRIMQEAQNALYYKNSQTPLLGGETPQLNDTQSYKLGQSQHTPNILAKRGTNGDLHNNPDGLMLPPSKRLKQTGLPQRLQTPLRDEFKLNAEDHYMDNVWEKSSLVSGMTNLDQQSRFGGESLAFTLNNLPQPKNKYEISQDRIVEMEEQISKSEQMIWEQENNKLKVEDLEEQEARLRREQEVLKELEKRKQSSVIKQCLPRPSIINQKFVKTVLDDSKQMNIAEKMILEELQSVLINDNHKYPAKGMKEIKNVKYFQDISPEYMEQARALIKEESLSQSLIDGFPQFHFNQITDNLDNKKASFFPGTKEYDLISNRTKAELIESMQYELENSQKHMNKELQRCEKLEKGLKLLFGGYYKKEDLIQEKFQQTMKDYQKKQIELEIFKVFQQQDLKSLNHRLSDAQRFLNQQQLKENELQQRYSNLRAEKERLEKTVISLKGQN